MQLHWRDTRAITTLDCKLIATITKVEAVLDVEREAKIAKEMQQCMRFLLQLLDNQALSTSFCLPRSVTSHFQALFQVERWERLKFKYNFYCNGRSSGRRGYERCIAKRCGGVFIFKRIIRIQLHGRSTPESDTHTICASCYIFLDLLSFFA